MFITYDLSLGCGIKIDIDHAVYRLWQLATDALPPQDSKALEEDLGIEKDTPEHMAVEQSPLCQQRPNSLKRKRI